jgi:hypothetical protein
MFKFITTIKNKIVTGVVRWIGSVKWHTSCVLTEQDVVDIRHKLTTDYYIILTRHCGYLSTYAISFAHFFLTGKWGYYSHTLMNLEDEVRSDADFRLIEATIVGVHYSQFNEVFDPQCSSVALLKPKNMSLEHWTTVMDKAMTQVGKPYDTLYDLVSDRSLSCVELIRVALKNEPNYDVDFANFEKMVSERKNLDPHMFLECPDFEVVWEARH